MSTAEAKHALPAFTISSHSAMAAGVSVARHRDSTTA